MVLGPESSELLSTSKSRATEEGRVELTDPEGQSTSEDQEGVGLDFLLQLSVQAAVTMQELSKLQT